MEALQYIFDDHLKIPSSSYIFQSVSHRKLSDIYHSHMFYEIVLLLRGSVLHIVNDAELHMESGDCVILTPKDSHSFISQSDDLELIGLSVKKDEFEALGAVFGIKKENLFPTVFSCLGRLGELEKCSERCYNATGDNENKLFLAMILNICSLPPKLNITNAPMSLSYAADMMKNEEYLKDGVASLVKLTNYSYPHLYRLMKQYYGKTPNEYVLNLKFETAYSKLIQSDMSIEEVSESIGFKSLSHFNTAFKEKFGISPAKLRKKYRSMYF